MPTNPYLDTRLGKEDIDLIESLTDELIFTAGFDVHYIVRKYVTEDKVMGEILSSTFKDYYTIEVVLEEEGGWMANDLSLSKFGLSFSGDSIKLAVSKRRFAEAIPESELANPGQPNVGDLLYVPFTKQFVEIVSVDTKSPYFSGGYEFIWMISCQPYHFSYESFERKNFNFTDEDKTNVIDEFVRQWNIADEKNPTSDTVCATTDSIDFTVDNNEIGVDRVLTTDREVETVDTEEYTADDDFFKKKDEINPKNDRLGQNQNKAITDDSNKFISQGPSFGFE